MKPDGQLSKIPHSNENRTTLKLQTEKQRVSDKFKAAVKKKLWTKLLDFKTSTFLPTSFEQHRVSK